MRAAWYERNGPASDVLAVGETEMPEPGPGEVRVKLETSGVNPSDVKSRRGRPLVGPRVIPHSDGGGVIDAIGVGADRGRLGERVWVWNGQWKRPFGTAAEYICVPQAQAVRLPQNIDMASAACLGIPALTAMHAVRLHDDVASKFLLVTGAGSSVGHYATQIAKARGARVVGTASGEKAAHARAAGADFVIDYKEKDVAAVLKDLTKDAGVDGIIDMDLSTTAPLVAAGALAPHGLHVCYGSNVAADIPVSFPAMLWGSLTLKVFVVYDLTHQERAAAIADLTKMLKDNALRHTIGAHYTLEQIAAAHEAVEEGKLIGNVVIDIA